MDDMKMDFKVRASEDLGFKFSCHALMLTGRIAPIGGALGRPL